MPELTIRIVIIEDRREIREGLRTLIAYTEGYECVAAYRSMEEALPEIERTRADVALVDIGLPGMSGIEGIQRLRRWFRRCSRWSCRCTTTTSGFSRPSAPGPAATCSRTLRRRISWRPSAKRHREARPFRPRSPARCWRCSGRFILRKHRPRR